MITTIFGLIRFGFSLIFGLAVSALFAGIEMTRKNLLRLGAVCAFFLLVQTVFWRLFGIEVTSKLYPLITHLPILVIFSLAFGRPWRISLVSVLSGYLCCQAPRWVGFLFGSAFGSDLMDHVSYIPAVVAAYYFLKKFVAQPLRQLLEKSNKAWLILGGVPLFYYLFDYFTTVYTDVLYTGVEWAVQFVPSMVSVFYFVFVILYASETQKQALVQRERDLLEAQFKLAQAEYQSLRQLQQNAAAYRHDMRHHLSLLQGLAADGRVEDIREYLRSAQSDIDAITPTRYCENDTVNLIHSAYAARARQAGVAFTMEASLPEALPLSDTELCSLLSNALENALHAAGKIPEPEGRQVRLRAYSKNSKLCVDVRNTFHTPPVFREGLPVSSQEGHGFGARSMARVVEKHGGVCAFSAQDGWFVFQATT